jgi:hypothetical protein
LRHFYKLAVEFFPTWRKNTIKDDYVFSYRLHWLHPQSAFQLIQGKLLPASQREERQRERKGVNHYDCDSGRGGGGAKSNESKKNVVFLSSSFSMGPLPSGGPALFSLKCDPCIEPDTVHSTARAPLVPRMRIGIKHMFAKATERNRKNPEKVGQCVVTMTVHM